MTVTTKSPFSFKSPSSVQLRLRGGALRFDALQIHAATMPQRVNLGCTVATSRCQKGWYQSTRQGNLQIACIGLAPVHCPPLMFRREILSSHLTTDHFDPYKLHTKRSNRLAVFASPHARTLASSTTQGPCSQHGAGYTRRLRRPSCRAAPGSGVLKKPTTGPGPR